MKQRPARHFLTAASVVAALLIGIWWSMRVPAMAGGEAPADRRSSDSRSVEAPHVNVMDFGAHPDNEDNTTQIQKAINTGKKAVVPPGNYAVNGTLDIGEAQYLHLSHGAWLRRMAARTGFFGDFSG